MKTWLFNPFKFIAGSKALIYGIVAMFVTAIVCAVEKVHLDGVIDIHAGKESPSYIYFIEPLIDWLCMVLPLYIFGRGLSVSAIRLVDVAGTVALARYPMVFAVIIAIFLPRQGNDIQTFLNTVHTDPNILIRVALLGLFIIPFIIWTLALMYNAYCISANLKGPKAIWSFIASFIIAEILSKVIIAISSSFN